MAFMSSPYDFSVFIYFFGVLDNFRLMENLSYIVLQIGWAAPSSVWCVAISMVSRDSFIRSIIYPHHILYIYVHMY